MNSDNNTMNSDNNTLYSDNNIRYSTNNIRYSVPFIQHSSYFTRYSSYFIQYSSYFTQYSSHFIRYYCDTGLTQQFIFSPDSLIIKEKICESVAYCSSLLKSYNYIRMVPLKLFFVE